LREYEFTIVVQPEISEEGLEGLCQKLEGVLERAGATRLFYEDWGRRRLAYEIQKFQKGHYLVMHFLDEGQAVPQIERAARLEDSVLRFLTVLAEEDVDDIEARKAESVKLEEERKQKAAERAAREAEEAAARAAEAEEAAARAAEAEQAAERAREAEGARSDDEGQASDDSDDGGSGNDSDDGESGNDSDDGEEAEEKSS
jgi:small subunit ribosomal protein S6